MEISEKDYARALCLRGGGLIATLTIWQIQRAYNGCGAGWMPIILRWICTKIARKFVPAVIIHDCQYQYETNRSKINFRRCNENFYLNCLDLSGKNYALRCLAWVLYLMLKWFGFIAWR